MKLSDIAILLPAFNEARKIGSVIKGIKKEGFKNIIVVNDGSKDSTANIAKSNGAIVYTHPINRGVGAALLTGMAVCKKEGFDIVVMLDSDGQHDVKEIKKVVEPIIKGKADLVLGSRLLRPKGMPFLRRVANVAISLFGFFLSGAWASDTQTGFRALNKKVMDSIKLRSEGYEVCSEMIIDTKRKGLRVAEVPIRVIYTKYSMAKGQSFTNGIKTLWSIFKNQFLH